MNNFKFKKTLLAIKCSTVQAVEGEITKNVVIDADTPILPRQMQQAVLDIMRESRKRHLYLNACTASGKTIATKFLFSTKLKMKKMRGLIAVPKNNIGEEYATSNLLIHNGEFEWNVDKMNNFTGDHSQTRKYKQLIEWLKKPAELCFKDDERVAVISHVLLAMLIDDGHGELLKNFYINIDEVHHAKHDGNNGNELGKALSFILDNDTKLNIFLLITTATSSRGDNCKIFADNHQTKFLRHEYNIHEYFDDSDTIKGFDYTFLPSAKDWISVTEEEQLIKRNDKTIIFMPGENQRRVTQKKKHANVRDLLKALGDKGTRIKFDSNGLCTIKIRGINYTVVNLVERVYQKNGLKYLKANPEDVDILLTVKIFSEGSDWPPANKGIIYGTRSSISDMIQMIGRIMRRHEKKVGRRKIVNIIHVVPNLDIENTPKEAYNDILKALNLALLFVEINMPTDLVVIGAPGESRPRASFDYVEAIRNAVPDITDNTVDVIIRQMGDVIVQTDNELNEELDNRDLQLKMMDNIEEMLKDDYAIVEDAYRIAEMFVLRMGQPIDPRVMTGVGVDVSSIDYNLIDENNAAEYYMSGMSPEAFRKWYRDVHKVGEQEAIKRVEWIVAFYNKHKRLPYVSSTDPEETMHARWLHMSRVAKQRVNDPTFLQIWYPIVEEIAIAAGYPHLFDSEKEREVTKHKEVIQWCNANDRLARCTSKNDEERGFGQWIVRKTKARKEGGGVGLYSWSDDLQERVDGTKWCDMFACKKEIEWKKGTLRFINFASQAVPSLDERIKIRNFRCRLRTYIDKYGRYPYPFVEEMITEAGLLHLLESKLKTDADWDGIVMEIVTYFKATGNKAIPPKSKDPAVRRLYNKREYIKKQSKTRPEVFRSCIDIANKEGYGFLFV